MNYQHSFHAGNFADVIKHIVYIYTLDYFKNKETPFFILDTHGGAGAYDLRSQDAQKTQEATYGVLKVINKQTEDLLLQRYFKIIQPYMNDQVYPGSPCIAASMIRECDVLRVTELHPEVYFLLKKEMLSYKNVHLRLQDGYEALRAYLPPKEKRGIVLIDPPYEVPDEFERCQTAVLQAYKKFPQGTYLIWYPIKDHQSVVLFKKQLSTLSCEQLEITISLLDTAFKHKLNKAGLLFLNPPYLLKEHLQSLQSELEKALGVSLSLQSK